MPCSTWLKHISPKYSRYLKIGLQLPAPLLASKNYLIFFSGTKRKHGRSPSYIVDPRKPRYPINQRWTNNRRLREVLPFEGVIHFDSGIRKTSFRYNISILKTFFKKRWWWWRVNTEIIQNYNSDLHETFGIMFWSCSKISSRVYVVRNNYFLHQKFDEKSWFLWNCGMMQKKKILYRLFWIKILQTFWLILLSYNHIYFWTLYILYLLLNSQGPQIQRYFKTGGTNKELSGLLNWPLY